MDYYSFTDPGGIEGWVGRVGWPTADTLPREMVCNAVHNAFLNTLTMETLFPYVPAVFLQWERRFPWKWSLVPIPPKTKLASFPPWERSTHRVSVGGFGGDCVCVEFPPQRSDASSLAVVQTGGGVGAVAHVVAVEEQRAKAQLADAQVRLEKRHPVVRHDARRRILHTHALIPWISRWGENRHLTCATFHDPVLWWTKTGVDMKM